MSILIQAIKAATTPPVIVPTYTLSPNVNWGADGDVTVGSNQDFYSLQTNGRSYPDAFVTNVTGISGRYISVQDSSGFSVGDTVLILNIMGIPSAYQNVGNYQIIQVLGVGVNEVLVDSSLKNYGNTLNDNIGTSYNTNQIVVLQRIPNYNTLTITSGLYPRTFNNTRYGIVAFNANVFNLNGGSISASSRGYPSGSDPLISAMGIGGTGGFGAGCATVLQHTGGTGEATLYGASGSHRTRGINSRYVKTDVLSSYVEGSAEGIYGSDDATTINFGAGAGGVYSRWKWSTWAQRVAQTYGGNGGGIIFIRAKSCTLSGQMAADGSNGSYAVSPTYATSKAYSGGGAGGTIYVEAIDSCTCNQSSTNLSAAGHSTYVQGGNGKVVLKVPSGVTIPASPVAANYLA